MSFRYLSLPIFLVMTIFLAMVVFVYAVKSKGNEPKTLIRGYLSLGATSLWVGIERLAEQLKILEKSLWVSELITGILVLLSIVLISVGIYNKVKLGQYDKKYYFTVLITLVIAPILLMGMGFIYFNYISK